VVRFVVRTGISIGKLTILDPAGETNGAPRKRPKAIKRAAGLLIYRS
jgi:hypothetical protein